MKQILFIHNNLQGGGAEKVLIDILNNFDYTKYEVSLLLLYNNGVYHNRIPKNVKTLILFGGDITRIIYVFKKLSIYKIRDVYYKHKLCALLKGNRYDTIVSFMEGLTCRIHDLIRNRANRNVSWVHIDLKVNNWCLNEFISINEQGRIYSRMDEVVFVSEGARNAFNDIFHTSRQKVIYNLIDSNLIREKSIEKEIKKNKFTVVTVGRLEDQKKQERIIEVARILKGSGYDIEFWIIGTGSREKELKSLVNKYSLETTVLFIGFQLNPYPYIKAADIFILTSQAEGYPLVVCESLCLGKPIVSTDVTGPHELLNDGTGIICDDSVERLSKGVELLYNNPDLLILYSSKAKQKSKMFNVEQSMQEIYNIL